MVRHVRVRAMCYVMCVPYVRVCAVMYMCMCHVCVCALCCVRHVCVCAMCVCEPCMYMYIFRIPYFNTKKKQQKKKNERRRHYHLMLKLHLHHGLLHIIPASETSSLRKLQIKSNSPLYRRHSGTIGFLLLWHETIAATSGSHVELIAIVR